MKIKWIKSKTIRKEIYRRWKIRFFFKIKSILQIIKHDRFHLIVYKKGTEKVGYVDTYDFDLLGINQRNALDDIATIFVRENLSAEIKMDKVLIEAEKLLTIKSNRTI